LSLPLHNLTTNDYTLRGGEGLIWLELTKLFHPATEDAKTRNNGQDLEPRLAKVFSLQNDKLDLTLNDYLKKADPHRSIRSSVPFLLKGAQQSIKDARAVAEEARQAARTVAEESEKASDRVNFRVTASGIVAIFVLVVSAIALYIAIHQVLDAFSSRVDAVESRIDSIQRTAPPATPVNLASPTPKTSP
jgi:hypothetical protein